MPNKVRSSTDNPHQLAGIKPPEPILTVFVELRVFKGTDPQCHAASDVGRTRSFGGPM